MLFTRCVISTLLLYSPLLSYDADVQKETILKENKKKAGVYRLVNKTNGKSYVGSSSSLTQRFYMYYSVQHLLLRKSNSLICRALLKYGYAKFTLEILEYCDPKDLLAREQFYIDSIKPKYNILKVAGSSLGRILSDEHKAKISASKIGSKHSEETLVKIREHLTALNKSKAFRVKVTDLETGFIEIYDSATKAAEALSCHKETIRDIEKRQLRGNDKPFRG